MGKNERLLDGLDESSRRVKEIKRITAKYKRIFKDKPEDKKILAEQVYSKAAYFYVVAEELMARVAEVGIIADVVNGNGITKRDTTPEYRELQNTVRMLNGCIDTLGRLCPEVKKEVGKVSEADELMSFIGKK